MKSSRETLKYAIVKRLAKCRLIFLVFGKLICIIFEITNTLRRVLRELLMKRLLILQKKEGIFFVNLLAEPNAKLQVFRIKKSQKKVTDSDGP